MTVSFKVITCLLYSQIYDDCDGTFMQIKSTFLHVINKFAKCCRHFIGPSPDVMTFNWSASFLNRENTLRYKTVYYIKVIVRKLGKSMIILHVIE